MKAREMERKMSRQSRLLKAPIVGEETSEQKRPAERLAAANQSPHTEAVLVPERSNRRTTCPRIRSAAAASADARDFNIAGTGPPRLASNQTLLHRLVLRLWYYNKLRGISLLALLYCAEAKDASCALVWIAIFSGGNAALHDERAVCHIPWRRSQAAAHPADRWIIDRRIMDRRIIDRRIMDRRITQPILSWEHAAPEHSRAAR